MYRRARRRVKQARIEVALRVQGGERLPFEDGAFDCVVSAFTLCSIEDVQQALSQVYRVLRPGGTARLRDRGPLPDRLDRAG